MVESYDVNYAKLGVAFHFGGRVALIVGVNSSAQFSKACAHALQ